MTLLVAALWLVTLPLVLVTLWGPRSWFRSVTSLVRPGTPEPTDSGYSLLAARNVLLTVAALAVTVPVTVDSLPLSEEELVAATQRAVDLIPDDDLSARRIDAEVEVLLGRDAFVDDVTSLVPDADDDASQPGSTETFYEVALKSRDDQVDQDDDAVVVCVKVATSPRSTVEFDEPDQSLESLGAGRCDAEE